MKHYAGISSITGRFSAKIPGPLCMFIYFKWGDSSKQVRTAVLSLEKTRSLERSLVCVAFPTSVGQKWTWLIESTQLVYIANFTERKKKEREKNWNLKKPIPAYVVKRCLLHISRKKCTHTHTHIYIYICVCVCVCVCIIYIYIYILLIKLS